MLDPLTLVFKMFLFSSSFVFGRAASECSECTSAPLFNKHTIRAVIHSRSADVCVSFTAKVNTRGYAHEQTHKPKFEL